MKYPAISVPPELAGKKTGVKAGIERDDIPNVGITDFSDVITCTLVSTTDPKTKKVTNTKVCSETTGTYYVLVDEGYGTSDKSEDFPLHYHKMAFKKEFAYNHAGHTTPTIYDDVERLNTTLITDPDKLISWKSEWDGHMLDIQVEY